MKRYSYSLLFFLREFKWNSCCFSHVADSGARQKEKEKRRVDERDSAQDDALHNALMNFIMFNSENIHFSSYQDNTDQHAYLKILAQVMEALKFTIKT